MGAVGRSSSSLHHHPAGSIEINVAVEQKAATINAVDKSNSNLILQSLLQHVLFLPGEVEQHRHSPDQLKGLTEEDKQVPIRCGPEPPTHALSEEGALELTSASLEDINLRTTCLRYSKLISRESFRSTELVTTTVEVGRLDAGGGSGQTFSCLSARLSKSLSFPSGSGSGFSF